MGAERIPVERTGFIIRNDGVRGSNPLSGTTLSAGKSEGMSGRPSGWVRVWVLFGALWAGNLVEPTPDPHKQAKLLRLRVMLFTVSFRVNPRAPLRSKIGWKGEGLLTGGQGSITDIAR